MSITPGETTDEGPAQRQEDLRQVQGDPPSWASHGHLRQRPPQAAAGLVTRVKANPSKANRDNNSTPRPPVFPRRHPRSPGQGPQPKLGTGGWEVVCTTW